MDVTSKLNEKLKVDVGLEPISLATTAGTGDYYSLDGYKRALFYVITAAMAAGKTVIVQVMEATSNIGAGAQALTSAVATIAANTLATKGLFTPSTVVDTDHVTVAIYDESGTLVSTQIYTAEDTTPVAADGEYATGANDTAAMVNMGAVVNLLQADYLYAVPSGATLILHVREPGKYTMTLTGHTTTMVASTLEAACYVEVDVMQLTATYTHVAVRATTDDTIIVGGTLLREGLMGGQGRAGQAVAASKVL